MKQQNIIWINNMAAFILKINIKLQKDQVMKINTLNMEKLNLMMGRYQNSIQMKL